MTTFRTYSREHYYRTRSCTQPGECTANSPNNSSDRKKQQMFLDIRRMSPDVFIFQQDSAPAHRDGTTSSCYDMKPQTSLDQMSGQRIHQTSIQLTIGSGADTRTRLLDSDSGHRWSEAVLIPVSGLSWSSVVDKAIEQWRPRLRASIRAKGQHSEQLLNWTLHFLV